MNIIISNSSGQPIYDQITSQIKSKIMAGELQEGDALPSMRFLAKELRISVITTKRAIYRICPGKGQLRCRKESRLHSGGAASQDRRTYAEDRGAFRRMFAWS